jgi:hypothetical protein
VQGSDEGRRCLPVACRGGRLVLLPRSPRETGGVGVDKAHKKTLASRQAPGESIDGTPTPPNSHSRVITVEVG